jgi:hypothetical protein
MTRNDFEYLCLNGVFEYEQLSKGRYYIPIDNIEEAIKNHVKHKVQKWLSSPMQSYTKVNWKSGTRL